MGSTYRGEPRALEDPRFRRPRFSAAGAIRRPPRATRGLRNASTTTRVAVLVLAAVCLGLLVYLVVLANGPSISNVTPLPNSTAAVGNVNVSATVSSRAKPLRQIVLKIDGNPVQPAVQVRSDHVWIVNFAAPLARGTHTALLQVTDTAGHTTHHSWSFQAEGPRMAPSLAFTGPPAGDALVAGNLKISLETVTEGTLKSVALTVNGKDTPVSFTADPSRSTTLGNGTQGHAWTVFSDPKLAPGDYLVHVTATDSYGGVSTSNLRFSVVSSSAKATALYFASTNQYVHGPFMAFWQAHDGAFLFGNPVSPQFVNDKGVTVQYFERARFELASNGSVVLGLLGQEAMTANSPKVKNPSNPSTLFFPETGHTLTGQFRAFWQQHGDLPIFGYPISEPIEEGGVQVQYFQRVRLELQPGSGGAASTVQIANLGTQAWATLSGQGQ